jgi:hypothetical protein
VQESRKKLRIDMKIRLYGLRIENVPRVSAAMRIPSLNLMARTLVPVTIGCLIDALSELYRCTKIYCVLSTLYTLSKDVSAGAACRDWACVVWIDGGIALRCHVSLVHILSTSGTHGTAPVCSREVVHGGRRVHDA